MDQQKGFSSLQEAFDSTVNKLAKQGKKAYDKGHGCKYLTSDGNKCAIGVHIPDGHSGQLFRGGVGVLIEEFSDLNEILAIGGTKLYFGCYTLNFWGDIQFSHDTSDTLEDLKRNLSAIAKRYYLKSDCLTNLVKWEAENLIRYNKLLGVRDASHQS